MKPEETDIEEMVTNLKANMLVLTLLHCTSESEDADAHVLEMARTNYTTSMNDLVYDACRILDMLYDEVLQLRKQLRARIVGKEESK